MRETPLVPEIAMELDPDRLIVQRSLEGRQVHFAHEGARSACLPRRQRGRQERRPDAEIHESVVTSSSDDHAHVIDSPRGLERRSKADVGRRKSQLRRTTRPMHDDAAQLCVATEQLPSLSEGALLHQPPDA